MVSSFTGGECLGVMVSRFTGGGYLEVYHGVKVY
jgi:hypothetical protein